MRKLTLALALGSTLFGGGAFADQVTIASAGPISGPQAFFGVTWQNGMRLYLDEVNKKGGVKGHTFTFSPLDDKADPREGTLVAQRFCEDSNVIAILGHMNSGVSLATLPVYSDCNMPDIVAGSNPTLTQQGYKNIVRPIANDYVQGELPAKYARETLHASKAAVVNDKQAFGQGVSEIFAKDFKQTGGIVTSVSSVNPSDVDFTALITQIKAQNPDVVYLGAVMPQLSLFAKQMHEQGLNTKLFVPDGGYTPDLVKQAGEEAAANVYVTFQVPPYESSPALVEFSKAYKARFNEDPVAYSAYGWIMAQVAVEAINKANKLDRASVIQALHSVKLNTILGPIEFDDKGDLKSGPVFLYHVTPKGFDLIGHS
jgi:branched-chain amino acid transport system substrate-binding protein